MCTELISTAILFYINGPIVGHKLDPPSPSRKLVEVEVDPNLNAYLILDIDRNEGSRCSQSYLTMKNIGQPRERKYCKDLIQTYNIFTLIS